MEERQLTRFGELVTSRLRALGKTEFWLRKAIKLKTAGSFSQEKLDAMLTGEYVSKPKEALILFILHEEAQRQEFKRKAGIKEGD